MSIGSINRFTGDKRFLQVVLSRTTHASFIRGDGLSGVLNTLRLLDDRIRPSFVAMDARVQVAAR